MIPDESLFNRSVIFYDQGCALCSHSVRTLMRWDRKNILLFAPLAGKTAHYLLPEDLKEETRFLIFFDRQEIFTRSTAFLKVLIFLGFGWVKVFLYLPLPIRDFFYRIVSSSRFHMSFFFKNRTPEEYFKDYRDSFLD